MPRRTWNFSRTAQSQRPVGKQSGGEALHDLETLIKQAAIMPGWTPAAWYARCLYMAEVCLWENVADAWRRWAAAIAEKYPEEHCHDRIHFGPKKPGRAAAAGAAGAAGRMARGR